MWAIFALGSALAFCFVSVCDKRLISYHFRGVPPLCLWCGVSGMLYGSILLAILGIPAGLPWTTTAAPVASGILMGCSVVLLFRGLRLMEASRAVAIAQTNPIFVALLAMTFLNERITLPQWGGIALVVAGAVLISIRLFQDTPYPRATTAPAVSPPTPAAPTPAASNTAPGPIPGLVSDRTPAAGTPSDRTASPAPGTPSDRTSAANPGLPSDRTASPAPGTPSDRTSSPAPGTPPAQNAWYGPALLLVSAMCAGSSFVVAKAALNAGIPTLTVFAMQQTVVGAVFFAAGLTGGPRLLAAVRQPRVLALLLFGESLMPAVSILLTVHAYSLGPASLVAAMLATRPLFVFAASTLLSRMRWQLLDESLTPSALWVKGISIIMIVAGAGALSLG